ncbi:hypothetical protein [Streptomyces sp. BF23-19]|uniref:hypothetical protein n=1 Tax=unclassified Streptomyces TaxID=2593676 RepID=UPI0034E42AC5
MAYKDVVVKLHHIFNDNTGDDPGNALELYGRWDAKRFKYDADEGVEYLLEDKNLWNRTANDPASVVEGTAFIIDSTVQYRIKSGEFLQIIGFVSEQDDIGGNDRLGDYEGRFGVPDLKDQPVPVPQFNESNQRVNVKITMKVLDEG